MRNRKSLAELDQQVMLKLSSSENTILSRAESTMEFNELDTLSLSEATMGKIVSRLLLTSQLCGTMFVVHRAKFPVVRAESLPLYAKMNGRKMLRPGKPE